MQLKHVFHSLAVVCITILVFIWMIRDSLCELKIYQESITILVRLACDVKR
ncbi:Hok/Gef family protein [Serratia liquefaciens]|uniref:Hok/Gef family protein n=1 Tax=Serratia liquefaciens TaxID=614 RepID=UPI0022B951AB|nr:Hok/Gef family protein [Serratia liquefaciens]